MPTPTYPDDSIQSALEPHPWWTTDDDRNLARGRLVRALVVHAEQVPHELIPEGRSDPTDHYRGEYRIVALNVRQPGRLPRLPVAALPQPPGERRLVHRGKIRPALVLSTGGTDIPPALRIGGARWQSSPSFLVAPYFGGEMSAQRGGWSVPFVERIRRDEYPQYLWDVLPLGGATESILRLDQLQPIGRHQDAYEWTPHRLSADALAIVDEWLAWLLTGELAAGGVVAFVRQQLCAGQ